MKASLLRLIRKFYEYKFIPGTTYVVVKNKRTGVIRQYNSIQEYVKDVSYTDVYIHPRVSTLWNKKRATLNENKKIVGEYETLFT